MSTSISAPAAGTRGRLWRSGAWLVGSNLSAQAMRLAGNLVLTRLLIPDDFGLMAAVNTLYFALLMFSDLGVWQSVVKSPHAQDPRYLGTAWSVQLLRGALLGLVVLALALGLHGAQLAGWPTPGTVYADARLPGLMAVFSLCAWLQGAESMKLALAQRALKTDTLARMDLTVQLLALATMMGLACWTHSVWALMMGTLLGQALRTLFSHAWLPGTTQRPAWDKSHVRELLGFGQWIMLSSVVGFLAAHGEKVLLAGALGATKFGQFSLAGNLLVALMGVVGSVNARLIFPAFSQALREGSNAAVASVYGRVQRLLDAVLGSVSGLLFMAGHWLVLCLYDSRYHDAGGVLQWLALGLLAMRQQVVEQWMYARGEPAAVTANNLLRAVLLAVAIPLGLAWGGERGALMGVVLSQFGSWPLSYRFRHRLGVLTWRQEAVWPLALGAGLALGAAGNALLTRAHGG